MSTALAERFWAKVEKTSACWTWTGFINPKGYGMWSHTQGVTPARAHRLSYELTKGSIPEGMMVDHMCFNRACVNPDHLRLATPAQNSQNREGATVLSSSGHRGVSRHTQSGKWQVKATKDGKTHFGGLFTDLEVAAVAAQELRDRLYADRSAA